jgi:N-acetyl-anhydromuramyl-L-alanine amidase AmpD
VLQQREMLAKTAEEKRGKSHWFGRKRGNGERIGGELKSVRNSYKIRFIVFNVLLHCFVSLQVYTALKVLLRLRWTWATRVKK